MLAQVEAPTSATQLAQVVVVTIVAIGANGVLGFVLQKLTRRAVRQAIGGNPVSRYIENINSTSVRIQLDDGSMWHAGHGSLESVNNLSQRSSTPRPGKVESLEP